MKIQVINGNFPSNELSRMYKNLHSFSQFSSVAQSCPTLCDPMNPSTPGLPVHHQLPKFTQTHVHQVGDAIQPSHPLLSPSPPAPIPPSIRVFSNESTLRIKWTKCWSFSFSISSSNEYSGLISCRISFEDSISFEDRNWCRTDGWMASPIRWT